MQKYFVRWLFPLNPPYSVDFALGAPLPDQSHFPLKPRKGLVDGSVSGFRFIKFAEYQKLVRKQFFSEKNLKSQKN